MGRDIALEHNAKCGMIRERRWVSGHPLNQVPGELKLEELAENVDHSVVGVRSVLEPALGLDPVEEFESALPVVAV